MTVGIQKMDLFDKIFVSPFLKFGPSKKLFASCGSRCRGGVFNLGPVVPPVPTFWVCKCNLGTRCVQYHGTVTVRILFNLQGRFKTENRKGL